jgi:hypothetical protein
MSSTMGGRSEKAAGDTESRTADHSQHDTGRRQRHAVGPGTSRGLIDHWKPKWKKYADFLLKTI